MKTFKNEQGMRRGSLHLCSAGTVCSSIERSIHKKNNPFLYKLPALTEQFYDSGDMHYLWRCVTSCSHDKWWDIAASLSLIHIKEQSAKSLRLVTLSIQTPGFKESSLLTVQLDSSFSSLVTKPTEMSQPWHSPTLEPTPGLRAVQDQLCSVHLSSLESTALNHMDKSNSSWLIFDI